MIKDDIINARLINDLNAFDHLHAEQYLLHISDVIFRLLDIEDNAENKLLYYELLHKAIFITKRGYRKQLNNLAQEMYSKLRKKKQYYCFGKSLTNHSTLCT